MPTLSHLACPRPVWRDLYIGAVLVAAASLFAVACSYRSSELVNMWGALGLFSAMLVAERLSVFVPREAKVSIATIPHIVAVLLLPPWTAMALAGGSMLADQLAARNALRKVLFNFASILLTVGLAAFIADAVGLDRDTLGQPDRWEQMPAFLVVGASYYGMTNGLVAIVMALDGG